MNESSGSTKSPLIAMWSHSLGRRVLSLAGLLLIVGAVLGVLAAAGLIGSQGGGSTSSGVKIENAVMLETQPPAGVTDFQAGPSVGKFAPDFEASRMDDGSRTTLSDYRGQPVYLNFWASWCIPCRAEMPDIDQLQREHPNLVVIGINREEPLGRAQGFLAGIELKDGSRGFHFQEPLLDPSGLLYDAYRGLGMPLSIFLDTQGRVVKVYNGQLTLEQMRENYALAATAPQ